MISLSVFIRLYLPTAGFLIFLDYFSIQSRYVYFDRRGLIFVVLDFFRFYVWSNIDSDLYLSIVINQSTWRWVLFQRLYLLLDEESLLINFSRNSCWIPNILIFLLFVILLDLHMIQVLPLGFILWNVPRNISPGRVWEHCGHVDWVWRHRYMICEKVTGNNFIIII